MQQLGFVALLVLGVAYAAFAIPIYFRFLSYCEQVAKATKREQECHGLNTNENSNNAFEREQYRKLRTGEYAELLDPVLVARGRELAVKIRLSWWLAVALVAAAAIVVFLAQ